MRPFAVLFLFMKGSIDPRTESKTSVDKVMSGETRADEGVITQYPVVIKRYW